MRYKIDMDHPLTVEASRRMHAVQPLKLLGWIFGGIGLLFLILGVIFVLIGWEYLPQHRSGRAIPPTRWLCPS